MKLWFSLVLLPATLAMNIEIKSSKDTVSRTLDPYGSDEICAEGHPLSEAWRIFSGAAIEVGSHEQLSLQISWFSSDVGQLRPLFNRMWELQSGAEHDDGKKGDQQQQDAEAGAASSEGRHAEPSVAAVAAAAAADEYKSLSCPLLSSCQPRRTVLSPFGLHCVRIVSELQIPVMYTLEYNAAAETPLVALHHQLVGQRGVLALLSNPLASLLVGGALYLRAGGLAGNLYLHYITGTALVATAFLLLGAYLVISRVAPPGARQGAFVAATAGYFSLFASLAWRGWASAWAAIVARKEAAAAAAVAVIAISFAIAHVSVVSRTQSAVVIDVIRWALQAAGLALVASATPSPTYAPLLAVVVAAGPPLVAAMFRGRERVAEVLADRRAGRRPQQNHLHGHRYQSAAQYEEIGRRETDRALRELQRSPAYQRWVAQNADRIFVRPVEHAEVCACVSCVSACLRVCVSLGLCVCVSAPAYVCAFVRGTITNDL